MLTEAHAKELIAAIKEMLSDETIQFPAMGGSVECPARSTDRREKFLIDANRKTRIKLTKCTFQLRHQTVEILLRLDIDGPPHVNPDGKDVPCPHLHIYQEGCGDQWAYPVTDILTDTTDLVEVFKTFLSKLCHVERVPLIQRGIN